jgi:hypothetical protein
VHRFRCEFQAQVRDELFSLMPTELACYLYGMRHDAHSRDSRRIGDNETARYEKPKTTFDGTKPRLVVQSSQNHCG